MPVQFTVLRLSDQRPLVFEEDAALGGQYPAGLGPLERQIDFYAALGTIRDVAGQLMESLTSLPRAPDNCELTFGIKLSAAAGAILAKAGAEANFEVKMTWAAPRT